MQRGDAALVVYDVCNQESLQKANEWLEIMTRARSNLNEVRLVGNKDDTWGTRQVDTEEGKRCAERWGIGFSECSAQTGQGILEVLSELVRSIRAKEEKNKQRSPKSIQTGETGESELGFFKRWFRVLRSK